MPTNIKLNNLFSSVAGTQGFNPLGNIQSFAQEQIEKLQERRKQVETQHEQNLSNFARFGSQVGQVFGNGTGLNLGGNVASSSTFSASSEDGKPVFSSISSHLAPDGTVTTVESGSDMPGTITVKSGNAGDANGIFSATGVHTDSNGNSDGFKSSGTVKI
ncbi:unnamed protein product [Orchesella dallaii]|uniref:Uncharacterized protein n=1 Tax=Orchesella dallaii TaxID=48710 RepID=A0ABP1S5Y6_9HEXA